MARIFAVPRGLKSSIAQTIPYALSAILLWSVVGKILALDQFSFYVTTLTFLPPRIQDWVTFAVPLGELVVACSLLLPATRRLGLYMCASLLLVFVAFLVYMVVHPYSVDCACFGRMEIARTARVANRVALGRNLVLLFLAGMGLWCGAATAPCERPKLP